MSKLKKLLTKKKETVFSSEDFKVIQEKFIPDYSVKVLSDLTNLAVYLIFPIKIKSIIFKGEEACMLFYKQFNIRFGETYKYLIEEKVCSINDADMSKVVIDVGKSVDVVFKLYKIFNRGFKVYFIESLFKNSDRFNWDKIKDQDIFDREDTEEWRKCFYRIVNMKKVEFVFDADKRIITISGEYY